MIVSKYSTIYSRSRASKGFERTHHMRYPTVTCPNFTSYISHVLSHSHVHERENKLSRVESYACVHNTDTLGVFFYHGVGASGELWSKGFLRGVIWDGVG